MFEFTRSKCFKNQKMPGFCEIRFLLSMFDHTVHILTAELSTFLVMLDYSNYRVGIMPEGKQVSHQR